MNHYIKQFVCLLLLLPIGTVSAQIENNNVAEEKNIETKEESQNAPFLEEEEGVDIARSLQSKPFIAGTATGAALTSTVFLAPILFKALRRVASNYGKHAESDRQNHNEDKANKLIDLYNHDRSNGQLHRWHIYSNWDLSHAAFKVQQSRTKLGHYAIHLREFENSEIEELLDRELELLKPDNGSVLLIGNGGAGAIGLVQQLFEIYSSQEEKKQGQKPELTVIWRAGHSFENFELFELELLESAITYEPHVEMELKNKGKIEEIHPLFSQQLQILAPVDDFAHLRSHHFKSALDAMKELMLYAYQHQLKRKIYVSRYNHSAMGERDAVLFRHALMDLIDNKSNSGFVRSFANLTKRNPLHFANDEAYLIFVYNHWVKHFVRQEKSMFPWDIIKLDQYYQLNDLGFIYREKAEHRLVTQSKLADDPMMFLPAQLLIADTMLDSNPKGQFISWLRSDEGQKTIEEYRVKGADSDAHVLFEGQAYADFGTLFEIYIDPINHSPKKLVDLWLATSNE